MKERIAATQLALADAKDALMRAEILLKNVEALHENGAEIATHAVVIPDPALLDEPPSRPA